MAPKAAALQGALIHRTLRTALAANPGSVSLWCAPDCEHPAFVGCSEQFGVPLYPQRGPDLGARMFHAFTRLCRQREVLVIGTDCPALTAAELRTAALALLEGNEAVFVPAEDGGYVLVGLRHPLASLFHGIPWGSDRVMDQTRERLRSAGLRWQELTPSWDVDRPEDIDRLRASGLIAEPTDATERAAQ
ncbi:MAG TPA: TIGR04282 family arsenosugar biosynthesis glycosyltransferase [Casimicrobiaceae bacterium]|nr:TIGR04282 family arsenosugar biosynthesis glycosyltransferase [Casimicrobiaceae bacterium]